MREKSQNRTHARVYREYQLHVKPQGITAAYVTLWLSLRSKHTLEFCILVRVANMASRQQLMTLDQIGSLLEDDTEIVSSGSDDDFDADLDDDFDPLEREQGNIM